MKYTIELTDTEYNVLTGFMDMISTEIKAEYFQKAKLEPTDKAWEDELEKAKLFAYKNGFEHGNKIADKDLKEIQDSTYDVAYNNALKDVNHAIDVIKNMTGAEFEEYFEECVGIDDVVCGITIQGIIRRTKAYEEKKKAKEEIKVGDVVKFNEKCHNYDHVKSREFLVLHIFDNGLVTLLYDNGDTGASDKSLLDKTGKHIDEVEQLLDKLRGEE